MKKLIITVTIISILNLLGCYYQEQMNPSEYNFNEKKELHLTTKDTTFSIGENDYYLEDDTLVATLSKKINKQTTLKTNVKIPIQNIETVEVERVDTFETILLTSSIAIPILLITYIEAAGGFPRY